ncbi:hypothetical protein ACFPIJ_58070 [Dactylosporangium cerinum]|uniref:HEAT repeat domain-containing protein n=1 Tax=Dactylosporangium cerinum TaxID=1434730 RepID=A0ABV9WHF7_9ACTN
MVEDPSELRNIIDETDWLALKGSSKSLFDLDTPDMLRGLVSSDVREVEMGLSHLVFGLGDGVNVMPATVPAVRYVLALLPRIPGETAMRPRVSGIRKPLRAHLLEWLGDTADAVSDDSERRFVDLAGFSPLKYPASPWHKVRQLRPQIFEVVSAFLEDQDPVTRREAIAAAVVLVRGTELAAHRDAVAVSTQAFLDASPDPAQRNWATSALEELRRPRPSEAEQ